ncbi:Phosphatases II [Mycena sanguinolenta]|uniref:phosphatidylinositol-3,4,5-trisphosphate 3-phosphatase n=1 Tax=Mycena sanguinolenta TaxID=230812 RepID=A0A8H7CHF4_9AGAR|nr:Phosphatases II [Mycena sanguinolenta]
MHVITTFKHVKRARQDDNELPRQIRRERQQCRYPFKQSGPVDDTPPSRQRMDPPAREEATRQLSFHLPFFRNSQSITPLSPPPLHQNPSPDPWDDERSSVASSSFPTFAPLDPPKRGRPTPQAHENDTETDIADGSRTWVDEDSCAHTSEGHEAPSALELDIKAQEDNDDGGTYRLSYRETTPSRVSHVYSISLLAPQIRRLLIYQMLFPVGTVISGALFVADALTHRDVPRPIGYGDFIQISIAWTGAFVFGNKARFVDGNLNLELDLIYLTDRVIIMGYPAEGFESFYRNKREDAKRFLEHRHGKNFWDTPFPDHHAPPLAIMPLAAREMADWLNGSPERVIVLHCKAGKGRSGTLACTYLLSLNELPTPPKLERSHTASEWAKIRANNVMQAIEHEEDAAPLAPIVESTAEGSAAPSQKSFTDSLKGVLDLHTARRMKPQGENQKQKQGVSIPSQRRWLHYWALLLAHEAPTHLWAIPPARSRPRVRLTQITVRMREAGTLKMHIVRAASAVLDRTNLGKTGSAQAKAAGNGNVWVSLARYDDDFVQLLEKWELHTRDVGGNMGLLRKDAGTLDGETLRDDVFNEEGKWDKTKMVRSFARFGATTNGATTKSVTEDGKILSYTLHPLTESGWVDIRESLAETEEPDTIDVDVPASEVNSMYDVIQSAKERGVVLDADREVRVKVYMGQIFICWLWFIPAFHMPPQPAGNTLQPPTKFTLKRKEVDFPVGVGSALIDVEMEMEWLRTTDSEAIQPPARQTSADSAAGEKAEPAGLAATVEAITAGNITDAVEAKQAAED